MEDENEEVEEGKGSALKIVMIGLLVLVLIAGAVVAWMVLGSSDGGSTPTFESAGSRSLSAETEASQTYALETFVVNLNDPGGKRYLKTNIQLEYTSQTVGTEIEQRLPQLRDLILLQLSSKGLDDIQSVDGKIALRSELIQRINQTLTSGKIRNLYFTEFVIQ